MNKGDVKHIIIAVILLLGQGLIDSYIHASLYLHLSVLPYIIILLPYRNATLANTSIGFIVGLIADVLGGGIIGFNTAALTAVGFAKKWFVQATINKDILEKEHRPTPWVTGLGRFSVLASLAVALYLLFFISLESIGSWSTLFVLLRFLLSFAVNLLIAVGLFVICNPKR